MKNKQFPGSSSCIIALFLLASLSITGCNFFTGLFGEQYLVDIYNEVAGLTVTDVEVLQGTKIMDVYTEVPGITDGVLPSEGGPGVNSFSIPYYLAAGDYTLSTTVNGEARTYPFTVSGEQAVAFYTSSTSKSPVTLKSSNFDQSIDYSVSAEGYDTVTGTLAESEEIEVTLAKEEIVVGSIDYDTWNTSTVGGSGYSSPSEYYSVTTTDSTPITEVTFSLPESLVPAEFEDNATSPVLSQTVGSPAGESGTFYNPYRKATITNSSDRAISSIVNTSGLWTLTQNIADAGSVTLYLPLISQNTTTYPLRINFADSTFLSMPGSATTATELEIDDDGTADAYSVPQFGTLEVTNSQGYDLIGIKLKNQFWLVGDPDSQGTFTIGTGMLDSTGTTALTIPDGSTKSFYLPIGTYGDCDHYYKTSPSSVTLDHFSEFSITAGTTTSITIN